MGLLSIMTRLQNYGYGLNSMAKLPRVASVGATSAQGGSIAALKAKFTDIVPAYMGALRGEVNPHFRMLLSRRKVLTAANLSYLFGIYTVHATRALWQAVDLVYAAVKSRKRVLFISDEETEDQLEIQSLNCMLYEPSLHPLLDELGMISFYYTSKIRTVIPLGSPADRYFDLVVVCLADYTRVNRTTFQPFARFTLGACAQNTRPDLFDYYVPAMGTYLTSVQLLRDVAILGYLAR